MTAPPLACVDQGEAPARRLRYKRSSPTGLRLAALRQRRFSIVACRRAAAGLTSILSGASLWGASVCFSVESNPGRATGRVALHDHGIPGFARCQGREVDGQLERSARRDDGVHVRPVEGGNEKPDPARMTARSACPLLAMVTWRVTDSPTPILPKSMSTRSTLIDGAPGAAQ